MIDIALFHIRQGYRVHPLVPNEKIPIFGGHGCRDATRDEAQVERWWSVHPEANIGLATGGTLLVMDLDPRKSDKWLESLNSLKLPQTFTVRTWSGGWHLYFTMPPDNRITIGTDLLPGIDWRANGGYVVSVGSRVNNAYYTIARKIPIARAPEALLERLRNRKTLARPVKDPNGHMVIPDGSRNECLFAYACLARRFGLEFNAVYEAIRAANADHCDPPLADEELRQIAASAMRYQQRTPQESA